MLRLANVKVCGSLEPISLNDTAATTTSVDTQGCKEVLFIFILGATTIAMDELSLTESDDDSSFTAITGTTFTDPGATSDGKIYTCHVDMTKNRKRYIKAVIDPGAAATLLASVYITDKLDVAPISAATGGNGASAGSRIAGLGERLFV